MKNKKNSIGVFDSGIGGITVLKSLVEYFPNENFIYLGDTARLPYGSKSPETIANYSKQNIEFLFEQGVKAIVIACNSASSHYKFKTFNGIPVYNVIEPGAQLAVELSPLGRIGVLGTRATISSNSYIKALQQINSSVSIFQQACPLFVTLAEEGLIEDQVTEIMASRYLESLLKNNVDTIILGCTHYPILKPTLIKIAGTKIRWIESGEAIVKTLKKEFENNKLEFNSNNLQEKRTIEVYTTDSSEQFLKMVTSILAPVVVNKYSVANVLDHKKTL